MISCQKHPDREAAGMCVTCGKPFCQECLVELNNKYFCKSCLSEKLSETDRAATTSPSKKKSLTIVLWFLLGNIGAHRYYTGHFLTGILYTILGLVNSIVSSRVWIRFLADPSDVFYIITHNTVPGTILTITICLWLMIDLIMILSGIFTDANGNMLD